MSDSLPVYPTMSELSSIAPRSWSSYRSTISGISRQNVDDSRPISGGSPILTPYGGVYTPILRGYTPHIPWDLGILGGSPDLGPPENWHFRRVFNNSPIRDTPGHRIFPDFWDSPHFGGIYPYRGDPPYSVVFCSSRDPKIGHFWGFGQKPRFWGFPGGSSRGD